MGLEDVKVALDWTLNTNHTGFVVAKALGYYKEEGLNVTLIEPGIPYVSPAERVRDGSATFAVAPSETAISSCTQTDKPKLQVICAWTSYCSSRMFFASYLITSDQCELRHIPGACRRLPPYLQRTPAP